MNRYKILIWLKNSTHNYYSCFWFFYSSAQQLLCLFFSSPRSARFGPTRVLSKTCQPTNRHRSESGFLLRGERNTSAALSAAQPLTSVHEPTKWRAQSFCFSQAYLPWLSWTRQTWAADGHHSRWKFGWDIFFLRRASCKRKLLVSSLQRCLEGR